MVKEVMMKDGRRRISITTGKIITGVLAFVLSLAVSSCTRSPVVMSRPVLSEEAVKLAKESIESIDPFVGDWQDSWTLNDGTESGPLVAQVIVLGKGKYQANFFEEFDTRIPPLAALDGQLEGAKLHFTGQAEYDGSKFEVQAVIEAGRFSGSFKGQDKGRFVMEKVVRLSPTLGAKPPADAVVLFDGKNFNQLEHANKSGPVKWELVNGAMVIKPGSGSIVSKKKFTNFKLHIEFRTPFLPEGSGQGRGNSGVYLQERYEIQVLDSYGREVRDSECGGIYGVAEPAVNMCAPPMQWQSYDAIFHAPLFDNNHRVSKDARLTLLHNGIKIYDNIKVRKPTDIPTLISCNITQPGGIYLQDHGCRVQFRNIWVVELP